MESIRQHFTPSVNASVYFSKSLAIGLPLSLPDTKRDGSCPMESIRQHFTPSVNASVYFSKSLAIGLPLSRTDTKRDGSCPMESIRQHFTPSVNTSMYFSKSLAIGLPLSRTDTRRDGSCPSVSDGVDPSTFYTLCKRFSVFFLSLSRSDFRSVGPLRIPDDPTQFGCIGHVCSQ